MFDTEVNYQQKFNTHIDGICAKVGQNINMSRIVLFMESLLRD